MFLKWLSVFLVLNLIWGLWCIELVGGFWWFVWTCVACVTMLIQTATRADRTPIYVILVRHMLLVYIFCQMAAWTLMDGEPYYSWYHVNVYCWVGVSFFFFIKWLWWLSAKGAGVQFSYNFWDTADPVMLYGGGEVTSTGPGPPPSSPSPSPRPSGPPPGVSPVQTRRD